MAAAISSAAVVVAERSGNGPRVQAGENHERIVLQHSCDCRRGSGIRVGDDMRHAGLGAPSFRENAVERKQREVFRSIESEHPGGFKIRRDGERIPAV